MLFSVNVTLHFSHTNLPIGFVGFQNSSVVFLITIVSTLLTSNDSSTISLQVEGEEDVLGSIFTTTTYFSLHKYSKPRKSTAMLQSLLFLVLRITIIITWVYVRIDSTSDCQVVKHKPTFRNICI